MEIQIPLVLFTTFLAWAAGIFSTQCILAIRKKAGEIQMLALIISVVILAIGGIAVMFHLASPLNIFNGFGNMTSGITQELIAVALLVIVMVLFGLMLYRSEDKTVPKAICVVGIIVSVALIIAMGHSYMMASRPAWDSVFQVLSLFGAACILGPASVVVIAAVRGIEVDGIAKYALIGVIVNAVLTVAYLIAMQVASGSLQSFDWYYDPTHPMYALKSASSISLFSGDCIIATVLVILALVVSVVGTLLARKNKGKAIVNYGVIVACGVTCTIALRIILYIMGASLFMLY